MRSRHSESGHGSLGLADDAEKTGCIKLYGLLASLMRGRALQLMKAVEDPNGFYDWKALNKALKPTSMARGLARLGAATTWPAFSMNSALQPQLLPDEVFDETVKSGITIQVDLKPVILLRCVGGQLKSCLNLTISDNVQYSTLREQVLQWERSQQKRATSMVVQTIKGQGPTPMEVDRAQNAKGTGKKGKNDLQKGKGKDAKGKGKKSKGAQKVISRAKVKVKAQKGKGAATCYTCGKAGHLAKDESCLGAQAPESLEKESGWRFNQHGLLVGSLLTSRFVDPTVIPEV